MTLAKRRCKHEAGLECEGWVLACGVWIDDGLPCLGGGRPKDSAS